MEVRAAEDTVGGQLPRWAPALALSAGRGTGVEERCVPPGDPCACLCYRRKRKNFTSSRAGKPTTSVVG
jgi:hypothetical protein